jgi:hypothetical protein
MSSSEGESEYVLVRDRYLVVTLLLLPTVTTVMRPTTRVMNWSARVRARMKTRIHVR